LTNFSLFVVQLDKTFTYAYTLSGHEFVANEDLDKAIAAFRHAIRYDDRHYNAWYGLGAIYYRYEQMLWWWVKIAFVGA
jgi:anaphase-promoting complex subunit 3